jgi:hypothetical protein
MARDELQNQLKAVNLDAITAANIAQVGDPVFPDESAMPSLEVFNHIVNSWRSVHYPSYGSPIPKTSKVPTVSGDGTLIQPTNNEVVRVIAASASNSSPTDPVNGAELLLGGVLVALMDVDPNGTAIVNIPSNLILDSNNALTVSNSSADLTVSAYIINLGQ